ncbi:MAG: hypothetical protein K0S79_414 [Nitrospira sp.]|nr:hypothetical protein [Nitrospira sp.]
MGTPLMAVNVHGSRLKPPDRHHLAMMCILHQQTSGRPTRPPMAESSRMGGWWKLYLNVRVLRSRSMSMRPNARSTGSILPSWLRSSS